MKNGRRLALRRESLSELTPAELAFAGGIADPPSLNGPCDTDDFQRWLRDVTLGLSVHQHCTWTCI